MEEKVAEHKSTIDNNEPRDFIDKVKLVFGSTGITKILNFIHSSRSLFDVRYSILITVCCLGI
jgi:hypothetical protein